MKPISSTHLSSVHVQLAARLLVMLCGLSQIAVGATLCVSANPRPQCYSTIGAAVAAASAGDIIQVSPGTYHEDVVIGKAISLIGENSSNSNNNGYNSNNNAGNNGYNSKTIIDATGLSNGIYVDGLDSGGIVGGSISGFQVQNANFEGILVTNASQVTITDNHVLKNDASLDIDSDTCPGQPAFETGEDFDCGEGIHLLGVDHSIVANNLVENNAGGILLSDDTGATHDNLILGNTVKDNPFDCGITLASHQLFNSNPPVADGVFHNTVTGNTSEHNGYQVPGAGAGVGLFAPAPFNQTYANVVVNNTLTDNGIPGVALHAHAPGATVSDNMIAGNHISGNGADTEDTATPGPTGINVSGGDDGMGNPVAVITGTVIAGNVIENETDGIVAKTDALVGAHLNDFTPPMTGFANIAAGTVDARLNWWGCPGGPTAKGCAGISGTMILYMPFLTMPF